MVEVNFYLPVSSYWVWDKKELVESYRELCKAKTRENGKLVEKNSFMAQTFRRD